MIDMHLIMVVFKCIIMWTILIMTSTGLVSILYRVLRIENERVLAYIFQLVQISLSLVVAWEINRLRILGLSVPVKVWPFISAALYSILFTLIFVLIPKNVFKNKLDLRPPIKPNDLINAIILLIIIAPLGEEILFRGLLEGFLLAHNVNLWLAILIPAFLFSLVHFISYHANNNSTKIYIVIASFVLGMLTGYFRAIYNSLILPVIIHTIPNTIEIVSSRKLN